MSPPTIAAACDDAQRPNSGGYYAAKLPRGTEPLLLMVPKDPSRQSVGGVLMTGDHAPFAIGSEAAVMVNFVRRPCKAVKIVAYVEKYYAARALAILVTLRLRIGRCETLRV